MPHAVPVSVFDRAIIPKAVTPTVLSSQHRKVLSFVDLLLEADYRIDGNRSVRLLSG
jgi:hypothetical protein